MVQRCFWVDLKDELYIRYHDEEWGEPVHDERLLFEMLVLESFQAGLSWQCVLHKREAFRQAFDNFDASKIALYTEEEVNTLCQNETIIRHRGKIKATVSNAISFLAVCQEFGSFENYILSFTGEKAVQSDGHETLSPVSDALSKDMRKRGFRFLGSTTVFSYLCAVGFIHAHTKECFKFPVLESFSPCLNPNIKQRNNK